MWPCRSSDEGKMPEMMLPTNCERHEEKAEVCACGRVAAATGGVHV
jgi:hypothetical protein